MSGAMRPAHEEFELLGGVELNEWTVRRMNVMMRMMEGDCQWREVMLPYIYSLGSPVPKSRSLDWGM